MRVCLPFRVGRYCLVGAALLTAAAGAQTSGPTTDAPPYLQPTAAGVRTISLLSVGDFTSGLERYFFTGVPDGMAARDNGDGTFSLLVSHSFGPTQGVTRAHGRPGSYISRWRVDRTTLEFRSGEDHILRAQAFNAAQQLWLTTPTLFSRLGSGDMAPVGAYFNPATGRGTDALLYFSSETGAAEGRAYAHLESTGDRGTSYFLPRLGRASWENHLVARDTGDATVIISSDSSAGGQIYVYVGAKTSTGNAVERAGLDNGTLFGVRVTGLPTENPTTGLGGPTTLPFTLASLGVVSGLTGAQLQTASAGAGVTAFNVPEDGAWDPANPNDFYFVTSGAGAIPSRLWRLRFADRANPALGGTIELLLTGSEGYVALENVAADGRGHLLLQEDPGNNPRQTRIWLYDLRSDRLTEIARATNDFFSTFGSATLTLDEESCGIIDATAVLGAGWFLANVQAHYAFPDNPFNPIGFVEGGQLLALYVPQSFRTGDMNCDGTVNFEDIDAFVTALASASAYAQQYPACARILADTSGDGSVDFNDIDDFVSVLIGG